MFLLGKSPTLLFSVGMAGMITLHGGCADKSLSTSLCSATYALNKAGEKTTGDDVIKVCQKV